jgi:type I restriction enzyme, S subunit
MNNWERKSLGDVCEIVNGSTPLRTNKDFWDNGNFPWFTIDDIREQGRIITDTKQKVTEAALSKLRVLPADTVLLCCTASVGEYAITKIELTTNQQFNGLVVKDRKKLDPEFLMHYCSTLKDKLLGLSGKTTIDFIAISKLKPLEIPLPPLPEQQRIVTILDEAFAAIAKAKANAEQNLKNAKELFESYLEDLFSILFRERDKRTVSELAKVIGGYSFKSTDFKKEGKYQVIRMGNVRPGIIRENESPVFIDEIDDKALSKALLLPNDVIITQTGTKKKRDYGFTVIIEKENYLLNQRIAAIRFSDKCLPKFFLYFSWTNIFKDQYFANESGTVGQGNVGISAITDASVPFITVKEQKEIVDGIEKLRAETQRMESIYQRKIDDLEELKKSILQKAFAGELKTEKAVAV